MGVVLNQCFSVWSLTGSQAFVWVVQPICCFGPVRGAASHRSGYAPTRGFRCGLPGHFWRCEPTQALCVCAPRQPGCLSGRTPTRGFRCGPQATDWGMCPLGHFGSGAQAAGLLIRVCAHPEFQLWAPSPLIRVCANWASGTCWGCLSPVHSPGAEGVGVQEATAAAESSLNSLCMPLFSLFLFEKFLLFKPPCSKQAPGLSHSPAWLSPKNPAADPAPWPGASATLVPTQVPGTLLSLSTLLTVRSFNGLYLWSPIFIYAGIPLAVGSVPQIS